MLSFVASRARTLTLTAKSSPVIVRRSAHGLTVMLWISAILSGVIAAFDREEPLDVALNHWDETMAFAALCCLACTFELDAPIG